MGKQGMGLSAATLLMLVAAAPAVQATTLVVNINSTITNSGSCTATNGTCPENYVVNPVPGATTQVVNTPPAASFDFGDAFNETYGGVTYLSTGSNFGSSATGSGGPWNFQDNILFTTTGGVAQAEVIAGISSVSDLQVRVISLTNPATDSPFNVNENTLTNAQELVGGPSVVTVLNGWTTVNTPYGLDFSVASQASVVAGRDRL
jgi:hypothetical protein